MKSTTFQPKCVATTSTTQEGQKAEDSLGVTKNVHESHFKSVQWTSDGTSLIACPADNSIQTFIVPPELLEEIGQPHSLSPYCSIPSTEPVNAVVGYPHFSLEDPSTALVLSSMRDHPIRLNSALTGHLGASYPLVNPMTEAYICPHSLLSTPQGDRFVAGSESLISVFDLSRPGQEPISTVPTGPKRRTGTDYSAAVNMRGIVSALAVDPATGILAAGTYGRQVGLYDAMGQGECVGVFSVQGTTSDGRIGGSGVTQVTWSPCGRYLYIAERKSDGVVVYDIRKTGQLLAWLEGRKAQTNQRLGVDLVRTDDQGGHEIWAGGLDGFVRMWKDPHQSEGPVSASFEFKAHDDVVSGVVAHRGGGVLATASGQRHFVPGLDEEHPSGLAVDNSLKIWTLETDGS
ncbi:WD40-repeat-containing domain protein [Exophiala viscosa]|uniref:WD40-repeat-containing domain protein n=1 Tax=Exophiala viscosa TaxID=2486360 RepID=A0AAN6E2L6_9EURO|nr:WD40-repeat-containing domain protein [Exophiala viscosa]